MEHLFVISLCFVLCIHYTYYVIVLIADCVWFCVGLIQRLILVWLEVLSSYFSRTHDSIKSISYDTLEGMEIGERGRGGERKRVRERWREMLERG